MCNLQKLTVNTFLFNKCIGFCINKKSLPDIPTSKQSRENSFKVTKRNEVYEANEINKNMSRHLLNILSIKSRCSF